MAHPVAKLRLTKQTANRRLEFLRILNLQRSADFKQLPHDVTEIERVRSGNHRFAQGGRFQHVLAADGGHAAANESDVTGRIVL